MGGGSDTKRAELYRVRELIKLFICKINLIALLFILIGLYGAKNKIRAGYYIFLYTFNLKCLKTKFRETPKALVTKAIKEILLAAGLIIHGMVTSLVFRPEGPGFYVNYV